MKDYHAFEVREREAAEERYQDELDRRDRHLPVIFQKGEIVNLPREQRAILEHTAYHAAQGLFCGDSPDMPSLVTADLMKEAGRKSFVPDN